MIKANELRIGNLVSKGNEWYVTDFITIKMAHNYEPIPLTPEILEMCGFIKNENITNPWNPNYIIKLGEDFPTRYLGIDSIHMDFTYGVHYNGLTTGRNLFVKAKYLHQLQNLYFSLTGEELKVNFHVETVKQV